MLFQFSGLYCLWELNLDMKREIDIELNLGTLNTFKKGILCGYDSKLERVPPIDQKLLLLLLHVMLSNEVPEHSDCRLVPYWREFLESAGLEVSTIDFVIFVFHFGARFRTYLCRSLSKKQGELLNQLQDGEPPENNWKLDWYLSDRNNWSRPLCQHMLRHSGKALPNIRLCLLRSTRPRNLSKTEQTKKWN